jgi:Caspase domain
MPLTDCALVVGIDRYPGLTTLSGAENDARDFHRWVTAADGGAVNPENKNTLLLLSSNFAASAGTDDAQPAKELIEQFFTQLDIAADANNIEGYGLKTGKRLWLFFSGHGFAPSLDRSGVLMANATTKRVHNVAAMLWADRFYEGGWFDEVLLFQDACRTPMTDADLTPPFLRKRIAPVGQQRRRFYAFSAKNRQLSKELPLCGPRVQGVFTTTLMQALSGKARDPRTGALTSGQLKAYLQDNMRKLLPPADLHDDEIAKMPEVFDPDPFDILPAQPMAPVAVFPVNIRIANPGPAARIEDSNFQPISSIDPSPPVWPRSLQRGLYKVVVSGQGETVFQVTGAVAPDGSERPVDVAV